MTCCCDCGTVRWQVDGSVSVTYRVQSLNLSVSDSAHKVNDDDYHIISFVRAGTAGVLRIDGQLIQSLQTPGQSTLYRDSHLTLFLIGVKIPCFQLPSVSEASVPEIFIARSKMSVQFVIC